MQWHDKYDIPPSTDKVKQITRSLTHYGVMTITVVPMCLASNMVALMHVHVWLPLTAKLNLRILLSKNKTHTPQTFLKCFIKQSREEVGLGDTNTVLR